MTPVKFAEHTIVIAEDQPEYFPLPAHVILRDEDGRMTFCWQLTWKERLALLLTGKLWHQVLTFGKPLQPQLLQTVKPEFPRCAHGVLLSHAGGFPLGKDCSACLYGLTKP